MTTDTDPLHDFLTRLRAAAADLPPEIREDLMRDLTSHLDEIRRVGGSPAQVQTAIDRLGSPEAIVRAAVEEAGLASPLATPAPEAPRRSIAREVVTVTLTVFGVPLAALAFWWFPPLTVATMAVAFISGLVLLWSSRVWTPGEKLLGTLVWPGGVSLPLWIGTTMSQVCTTFEVVDESLSGAGGDLTDQVEVITTCTGFSLPPLVGVPLFLVLVAAPVVVGAALLRRAQRRADDQASTDQLGEHRPHEVPAPRS